MKEEKKTDLKKQKAKKQYARDVFFNKFPFY